MDKLTENLLRENIKKAALEYFKFKNENSPKKNYIPPSGKLLGFEELSNMLDASLDMWLTTGRFNEEFEKKFAKRVGAKFALTTNSGSSANLLAISALMSPKLGDRALKKGDEVITVAAGFPTTVAPIIQNGLVPVFVDVQLGTYNADVEKIREAVSPKTKAVFMAHTLGTPFDLDAVGKICKEKNLWLVEDSCDALGATHNSKPIGSFGDISTFSFYPAHHITMGEGGAVATSNALLRKIVLSLRDWGRDCWCAPGVDDTCRHRFATKLGKLPDGYDHKYTYSHVGYNLKITDWQAAIGLAQLDKLDAFLAARRKNAETLRQKLLPLCDFLILPEHLEGDEPSNFGFTISVKPNEFFGKRELVEHLESVGVGTRQLFAGNILRQPMMTDNNICLKIANGEMKTSDELSEADYEKLPATDFIMNNTFWVGCQPSLSQDDIEKTASAICEFVSSKVR